MLLAGGHGILYYLFATSRMAVRYYLTRKDSREINLSFTDTDSTTLGNADGSIMVGVSVGFIRWPVDSGRSSVYTSPGYPSQLIPMNWM